MSKLFINRNFSILLFSQGFSQLGDNLYYIALIALIYSIEKSSSSIGILMVITIIPVIIVGPIAGVLVDRWNKKSILLAGDITRGLLLIFIVVFPAKTAVYIITFLVSLVDVIFKPALSACIPEVIEEDKLLQGNSIFNSLESLIVVLAPTLSGLLVASYGSAPIFAFNAISFLGAGVAMKYVSFHPKPAYQEGNITTSFQNDLSQGILFIMQNRITQFLVAGFVLLTFSVGALNVLALVYFEKVLSLGVKGYGFFESAWGAGMFIGAVLVTKFAGIGGRANLFLVGLTIIGIAMVLMVLFPIYPLVLLFGLIIGGGNIFSSILSATVLQEIVPQGYRGRVFATRLAILQLASVFAMGAAGILADLVSIQAVLGGAGTLLALGGVLAVLHPGYREMKVKVTVP